MGLLDWLFGSSSSKPGKQPSKQPDDAQPADVRHALLLHLVVAADDTDGVIERYHAIQDELEAAVLHHHAGELDGDEWSEGLCTVYFYGPDADLLWDAVAPILEKHLFPKGSHAIRQYGPHGSRTERIDLAWDG
jgi:hypothetical protein